MKSATQQLKGVLNPMREIQIVRTNEVPLNFVGDVVAFATTNNNTNARKTRWTELTLYETKSGKFVSESVGVSTHDYEMNITYAEVFDRLPDAIQFFRNKDGHFTWASGQIIEQAREKFGSELQAFGETVE